MYSKYLRIAAVLLPLLALSADCFRFDEATGGLDGGGIFGEAGLNAVPRIGKKRSINTNPFSSRFRFRFRGPSSPGFGSGSSGFRFRSNDDLPQFLLKKKKMDESIPEDLKKLSVDSSGLGDDLDSDESVDEHLKWYKIADQYWRDYLESLARRDALQRMSMMDSEKDDDPYNLRIPLSKYLARQREKMFFNSRQQFNDFRNNDAKFRPLMLSHF